MSLIKSGYIVQKGARFITPQHLPEEDQKVLIEAGLIPDEFIVKREELQSEPGKVEDSNDDYAKQLRAEIKELGGKAGGRASIEKLEEILKDLKGE